MTIEEYIEKYGEYGGRLLQFYDNEGSPKILSDDSKKLLDIINKNYIKSLENKDDIDKNIRLNISYLADFYLSLFKEMKGESVLQKQIIIDPDEIRKLLAPWGYDKTNAPEYHLIGGELTNAVSRKVFYEYDVKNIAFITGAPASGKSSALRNEAIASKLNLDSYAVIYDSPITSFSIFAKNIANPLLEKGIKISYIQVYNDPVTIFENMLKRGVKEGRFLPPLYFLNGLLAQKDRVRDIASEFKGKEHFTYFGIDNSGNIAKEKLCDLKEAEKIFDYNITLSQINKMLAYGEDYRKHLQKERERIESTGQTGGTRQDVHGGDRLLSVARTTRDNENTIADVIRGLLHVEVALQLQLRESLLYNAGTMENPMVGVGREGDGGVGNVSVINGENIDHKAIKDELIRNAGAGIKDLDLVERAKFIFLGEELATNQIQQEMDKLRNPEKYLPPHYKAMLETNIDDENKFQQGEFAKSERVFTLKKWDYVMGSTNISGPDKVAEMFRHLESFGVENSFAVFIPKGEDGESKAIVQHLSSGERSLSFVNPDAIIQAALRCDAKDVYFVHNHPSGSISPSPQDYQIYSTLSKGLSFFGINLKEGVIINTNTAKYGTFNSLNSEKHNLTKSENLQPYSVLEFSRTIFNKDYKPEDNYKITDSRKVAEFLSRQRFGEGNKIGYFVLNNQLQITGNFFLKETEINSSNVDKIAREVGENAIRYSGACTMLYGRFNMSPTIDLQNKIKTATCNSIRLIDIITFQSKDNLYQYKSFADEGLLQEEKIKYNTKRESVNEIDNKEQQKESDVQDKIKVLTEQKRNFEVKITAHELGIEYIETQIELKPDNLVNHLLLEDTAFQLNNLKKEMQDHIRGNEDNKEHVDSISKLIKKVDSLLLELSPYTKNSEELKQASITEEKNDSSIKEKKMTLPKQIMLGYCQTTELKNSNGEKLTLTLPKLRLQLDLSLVDKKRSEINITKASNGDEYLNLAVIKNNSKKKESTSEYIVISKRNGLDAEVCGKKVKFKDINSVLEFSVSFNDLKDKIQRAGINDTKIPLNIGSFSGPTRIKINNKSESVTNKNLNNEEYSLKGNLNVVNLFDRLIKTKQNLEENPKDIKYDNLYLGSGIELNIRKDTTNSKDILIMMQKDQLKSLPECDHFGNIKVAICNRPTTKDYLLENDITYSNGSFYNSNMELIPRMYAIADPKTYKNGQPYENTIRVITLKKDELMNLPTINKNNKEYVSLKINDYTGKVDLNTYMYVVNNRTEEVQNFLRQVSKNEKITIDPKKPYLTGYTLTSHSLQYDEKIAKHEALSWAVKHKEDKTSEGAISQYDYMKVIQASVKEKISEKIDAEVAKQGNINNDKIEEKVTQNKL